MKSKDIACRHCGTMVLIPPHRFATFKYCSRRCGALAIRVEMSANCHVCGKHFSHIASRANSAKYCSRGCYYKAMHIKGTVRVQCHHCGKVFQDSPSTHRKFCSRQCTRKSSIDVWQPGFQTARKNMIHRDMLRQCERCGYREERQILVVHHRDRNRRNNALSNLEVLCPNCHALEHRKKNG